MKNEEMTSGIPEKLRFAAQPPLLRGGRGCVKKLRIENAELRMMNTIIILKTEARGHGRYPFNHVATVRRLTDRTNPVRVTRDCNGRLKPLNPCTSESQHAGTCSVQYA
jgi:hypothetical protein